MSNVGETPEPEKSDPWKRAAAIIGALIGAGAGWYYYPNHPLQGLFWGSICGAFAVSIIWSFVED